MTIRCKNILIFSLDQYAQSNPHKRIIMLDYVQEQLKKHYNALEIIGMGLDKDMVCAAQIFLRIVQNENSNT